MLAGTPVSTMSSDAALGVDVGAAGVGVLVGVRVAVGGGVPGVGVRVGVEAAGVGVRVGVGVGVATPGVGVGTGAPVVRRTAIQSSEKSLAVELATLITRTRKLALESCAAVHARPQVSAAPPST